MESTELLRLIVEITSLALSLGALADVLWFHAKTKIVLAITAGALVLLCGLAVLLSLQHERKVERAEEEILHSLGPEVKTSDQILESQFEPEFPVFNEALEHLIREKKVGYRALEVRDDKGQRYTAGGFYCIAN